MAISGRKATPIAKAAAAAAAAASGNAAGASRRSKKAKRNGQMRQAPRRKFSAVAVFVRGDFF